MGVLSMRGTCVKCCTQHQVVLARITNTMCIGILPGVTSSPPYVCARHVLFVAYKSVSLKREMLYVLHVCCE